MSTIGYPTAEHANAPGSGNLVSETEGPSEDLHRIQRRLEHVLHCASEGIVGLDSLGKITFANRAAAEMLGWKAHELTGQYFRGVVNQSKPDSAPDSWGDFLTCIGPSEPSVPMTVEMVIWRRDGTNLQVECSRIPVADEGDAIGAVVTFQDVTERKLLQSQLVQAQKLESIGQLAAGIAHEINTPTQYVGDNVRFLDQAFAGVLKVFRQYQKLLEALKSQSPTEYLVKGIESEHEQEGMDFLVEEIPKSIAQTLEGVDHVADIVRSMKAFSHPGDKDKTSIDLNSALRSTVAVARNEWKYVAQTEMDLDPSLPAVPGLPGELNQVFLNLVINAAQAIGEVVGDNPEDKGTIRIATRQVNDEVEIRISDTGPGIPEEVRSRVFDPFFTTKEVGKGTGQGLAIAHSVIVEKHGGSLRLETETGEGATFIIRLPITDE